MRRLESGTMMTSEIYLDGYHNETLMLAVVELLGTVDHTSTLKTANGTLE